MNYKIDIDKLVENLTDEVVIEIMTKLGADRYVDKMDYILFPTICHNEISEEASMKLYYYKDTKLFHCYTECDESFSIFKLCNKVYQLRGESKSFVEILDFVANQVGYEKLYSFEQGKYKSEFDKYRKKKRQKDLECFDEGILKVFDKKYPIEWLAEGIAKESMDEYNILYSISRNKIIIPHYDIEANLIGIRGRALNPIEIEQFGKYMPLEIEGKWYTHPLSYNLYGLNISKKDVAKAKQAIIYEGEKSCLKHHSFFPNWNISVAACGSTINKSQIDLLIKNFDLDEIVLAFDKEYSCHSDDKGRKYFNKLDLLCKKYSNYCNFSFIYDKNGLLKEKDSPVDRGPKIFKELYDKRIKVRSLLV